MARREGQEGSRWVNYRPTGEEVADWFEKNVKLHEGLEASSYVTGITLIQSTEKSKAVVGWDGDQPQTQEQFDLVYTPYPRVDIRVRYWQDYLELHRQEMIGVLERVAPPEPSKTLPEGFFRMDVGQADSKVTRFVCCSLRARIYKRGTIEYQRLTVDKRTGEERMEMRGEVLLDAPPATKMIPILSRYGPDPFSLMKAETGAVGRALALAGMLVVPGAGVASAEDLIEAQQMQSGEGEVAAPTPEAASLPEQQAAAEDPEALRTRAGRLMEELKAHPERHKAMVAWARERKLVLADAELPALRGVIRKLERELDEAKAEVAEQPTIEAPSGE